MASLESKAVQVELLVDQLAVMEHVRSGVPLDPSTYRRVRERAEKITERLRQQYGEMNIAVDLIRETRNGE